MKQWWRRGFEREKLSRSMKIVLEDDDFVAMKRKGSLG
jgi:hypothetical protein